MVTAADVIKQWRTSSNPTYESLKSKAGEAQAANKVTSSLSSKLSSSSSSKYINQSIDNSIIDTRQSIPYSTQSLTQQLQNKSIPSGDVFGYFKNIGTVTQDGTRIIDLRSPTGRTEDIPVQSKPSFFESLGSTAASTVNAIEYGYEKTRTAAVETIFGVSPNVLLLIIGMGAVIYFQGKSKF